MLSKKLFNYETQNRFLFDYIDFIAGLIYGDAVDQGLIQFVLMVLIAYLDKLIVIGIVNVTLKLYFS